MRSVRLQLEALEDRTVPSASSLRTGDVPLRTDSQLSEPVIAFGSPSSEELNDLTPARPAAKPVSLPQENNVPNNAALAGVGSGGGGSNASSTPFTPGGGNFGGGGGGGGGGANWNQLLNNLVNIAKNAAPTMPATTTSTPPATPAAATSPSPAVGVASSVSVSAATTGHRTASGSTSPGAKLLTDDSSGSQVYNTPGTYEWTVPDGVTSVSVQLWGAGGGGAGAGTTFSGSYAWGGGGGGAGAYVYVGALSVTPGQDYTVVVGAGGVGSGVNGGGVNGRDVNGGTSSFANIDASGGTAGGGEGIGGSGAGGSGSGGKGGTPADGGSSNSAGGGGGGGASSTCGAGGNGGDASGTTGGVGGSADMGSGEGGAGGDAGSPGSAGQGPGGGGGGGGVSNGVGFAGGNGADGEVIITWVSADNSDTLLWNPCMGSTDASLASNWYDETQGIQGIEAPGTNNAVVFDGMATSVSGSPITWTQSVTVASMTIQNYYTAQMTVTSGNAIEVTGANGEALYGDDSSELNMTFGGNSPQMPLGSTAKAQNMTDAAIYVPNTLQLDGDSRFPPFNFIGPPGAQVVLTQGTTVIAMGQAKNPEASLGVNLVINQGATLNDQTYLPLTLTASNVFITVKGEMDMYWGTGTGSTLIQQGKDTQGQNTTGGYIDVNGGLLKYIGNSGVKDTFAIPVLVENGGTFSVTTSSSSSGGWLIVKGQVQQTQKYSVYMGGANINSSVKLSNETTLECDDDYQQTNGTLQTTDESVCTLQDGANGKGTAVIAGGNVIIANNADYFGELDVNCSTLNFAGVYKPGIDGEESGTQLDQDWLRVKGTMTIQNMAFLSISVPSGNVVPGNSWTVITASNNLQPFAPGQTNENQWGLKEQVTTNYTLTS